jgi:hypothetical protein
MSGESGLSGSDPCGFSLACARAPAFGEVSIPTNPTTPPVILHYLGDALDIIAAGLARVFPAIRPSTTVAPLPASAVGSLVAGQGSA